MMDFRFFGFHIFIAKRKEVKNMAPIYVALIEKGLYTYKQVPTFMGMREQVKEMLIALDLGHLVIE